MPDKSKKKPPSKPKRPLSAYNCFFKEERERILSEEGSNLLSFEAIGRLIGERWKKVDPTVRARLQKIADKDTARYQQEIEAFYDNEVQSISMGQNSIGNLDFSSMIADASARNDASSNEPDQDQIDDKSLKRSRSGSRGDTPDEEKKPAAEPNTKRIRTGNETAGQEKKKPSHDVGQAQSIQLMGLVQQTNSLAPSLFQNVTSAVAANNSVGLALTNVGSDPKATDEPGSNQFASSDTNNIIAQLISQQNQANMLSSPDAGRSNNSSSNPLLDYFISQEATIKKQQEQLIELSNQNRRKDLIIEQLLSKSDSKQEESTHPNSTSQMLKDALLKEMLTKEMNSNTMSSGPGGSDQTKEKVLKQLLLAELSSNDAPSQSPSTDRFQSAVRNSIPDQALSNNNAMQLPLGHNAGMTNPNINSNNSQLVNQARILEAMLGQGNAQLQNTSGHASSAVAHLGLYHINRSPSDQPSSNLSQSVPARVPLVDSSFQNMNSLFSFPTLQRDTGASSQRRSEPSLQEQLLMKIKDIQSKGFNPKKE